MNLNQDTKPEHAFYCKDGSALKNLTELAEKLKTISADAYRHHANEYKNDFRNWIKDVYCNEKLAKEIALAGSSREAARIVAEAIAPPRKKKPAKRKKSAAVKRKKTRKKRDVAKKARLAVAVAVAAKKKEKKKPARKIRKRKKITNKKITLRRLIHSNLKGIARQLGFL